MKTLSSRTKRLLAMGLTTLCTLLVLTVPVWAQLYRLNFTTLNGAINSTQTTLVLTSASAVSGTSFGAPAAGQCLWVDRELMTIVSMTSTTATVRRATQGNSPHATLAVIFTGACSAFRAVDPYPSGNVTCTAQPFPWINVQSGNVWYCNTALNRWSGTNVAIFAYNSVPTAQ